MMQVAISSGPRRGGEGRRIFKMAPFHHHLEMLGGRDAHHDALLDRRRRGGVVECCCRRGRVMAAMGLAG